MVLLIAGMLMVLSFEWNNPATLGHLAPGDKVLASFFTSVNYRTAGFNTIDIGGMKEVTLFFSTLFMVIGGAPGSTAGGIKITTVFVLLLAAFFTLKNRPPVVFKRRIGSDTVARALAILIIASVYIWISLVVISELEPVEFTKILFEVVSAFGTVGLSIGNGGVLSTSALFGETSKVVIILLMIMGRVGVLAFTLLLLGKTPRKHIDYPEGRILL